ncbi:ferroxidase [Saccharomycopsis crataegensis]|uniref:ferroxidase n=1 Tax=Saccharomycopsis crataegensis TaxID=43959 RepID=A0AAV5QK40_9ASCO|nr:ferroxidase [Saccharomycopsis crataegensis]
MSSAFSRAGFIRGIFSKRLPSKTVSQAGFPRRFLCNSTSQSLPLENTQHPSCRKNSRGFQLSQKSYYSVTTDGKEFSQEIDEISIGEYHKKSDLYLESLVDQLEILGETYREIDVDYSEGVLNMELPPLGDYCINKQPPNKQIWSSSPVSGPNRYDLIKGKWISLRDGSSLTKILEDEIKQATGLDEFTLELD